jgi:DNA-binding transcriptional LysR family regulator
MVVDAFENDCSNRNNNMTDLNHVSVFIRVVESGSFSAAARLLAMPKATVSRSVARLESDLGTRLLNRTTRKLVLTAQGRTFYDGAARGLAHLDAAREQIAAARAEPAGTLRVTAPVGFGSHYLVQWIPEFLATFQKVSIELRLTDALVDLIEERIDVALRTGKLASSSLIARKLALSRRVLVASPTYLDVRGMPCEVDDLVQHSCVVFGPSLDNVVWRLDGPDGTREIPVSGRLAVDGAQAALQAAIAGIGIALLPMALVADGLRDDRLRQVLPGYDVSGGLFSVYPSNRHISTALRAFLDFVERKAADLPR